MPGSAWNYRATSTEAVLDAADIDFNKLMRERLGDGAHPTGGVYLLQLHAARNPSIPGPE